MSATYRMAKAYQEQLLHESGLRKKGRKSGLPATAALRRGIAAFADRLMAALLLLRRATDAETRARSSLG